MKVVFTILALTIGALLVAQQVSTMQAEKDAPPIGKFVDVEGERLHVVDIPPQAEAGPPILLIHGATVNLRDMKMALGHPLSERHRVIIIDRPGRGYSTRPKDGWKLDVQARFIHRALEELGVAKPVVVGQSYGGAVALAYSLQYQDDMTGLVLLAPVSHPWPTGIAWYNKVSGWPVAGTLLRRFVIPFYGPYAAKSGVPASFGPDKAPETYVRESGLNLVFRPLDFEANAADLRTLKEQVREMSNRYGGIRVPTAILTGLKDNTVSRSIHSEALAREIPEASYVTFPDTGHALHHSRTAEVVAAIEAIAGAGR
jgi:pimeloyl-ACP methyl ester carboxylesterase